MDTHTDLDLIHYNNNTSSFANFHLNFNLTNVTQIIDDQFTASHSLEKEFHLLADVKRALHKAVTPTLCVVGCTGNFLNLLVLTRIRMRKAEGQKDSGTNLGLILLAVSDMLFCVTLFPRSFIAETKSLFEQRDFWCFYQVYGTGVVTTFILTSTWITVVMATIRYIGICHPFCFWRIDGFQFARITYVIVTILCVILNFPSFFQYKITDLDLTDSRPTVYLLDIGYLDQRTYRGLTFMWLRFIFGTCIPLIIMSFCNISLISALQQSYKMRRRYHVPEAVSSTSNRVTLTLIIIVMFFVVLVLPSEIMDFFSELVNSDVTGKEIFLFLRAIANILQVLNFSFNFILYCIVNVHFRGVLLDLASCGRRIYQPSTYGARQTCGPLVPICRSKV